METRKEKERKNTLRHSTHTMREVLEEQRISAVTRTFISQAHMDLLNLSTTST